MLEGDFKQLIQIFYIEEIYFKYEIIKKIYRKIIIIFSRIIIILNIPCITEVVPLPYWDSVPALQRRNWVQS